MVVQGIAPSIWGPFSDTCGRRRAFISTFIIFLISNIGLGLSRSLMALMVFRAMQAAGSAATIAIGKCLAYPRFPRRGMLMFLQVLASLET